MSPQTRSTYLPSSENSAEVEAFALLVSQLRQVTPQLPCLLGPDGRTHAIPASAFDALVKVTEALSAGQGVSVMPTDTQLTTQQAADFLGISRPTLVKLLERGDIPFQKVGRHRRVMLRDLRDFDESSRVERHASLEEISREGHLSGALLGTAGTPPRMR